MWLVCTLALLAAMAIYRLSLKIKHLPPGPKPFPFLGNLLDIPHDVAWKVYADWGHKYGEWKCIINDIPYSLADKHSGPIVYFRVMQKSIIVINSVAVAHDLLEKRSAIYSCRPWVPMAGDVYVKSSWSFCAIQS